MSVKMHKKKRTKTILKGNCDGKIKRTSENIDVLMNRSYYIGTNLKRNVKSSYDYKLIQMKNRVPQIKEEIVTEQL